MPYIPGTDIGPVLEVAGDVPLSKLVLTIALPAGPYTDFSDCIESLPFDEQPGPSLPDGIPAEDGESARTGTLTLAGPVDPTDESITVWWLLNPDNADSPMFRQQVKGSLVTLEMGVPVNGVDVMIPQWTMEVSSVDSIDPLTGAVSLSLADPTDMFADMSSLPAVLTDEPQNAGLTSEFVLDLIARATTAAMYGSWPAQRNKCILAAGMRTSVWPEVGSIGAVGVPILPAPPVFDTGKFGSALSSLGPPGVGGLTYTLAAPLSLTSNVVELWWGPTTGQSVFGLNSQSNSGGISYTRTGANLQIAVGGGGGPTYTFTGLLNTTGAAQYVALHFTSGGGSWNLDMRVDGVTHSSGSQTGSPTGLPQPGEEFTLFEVNGTIEGLQVTNETSPSWNNGFTPKLILDSSLNPMQAVPAIDTTGHGWDEMQTCVQAECGFLYLDNETNLVFRNRDSIDGQSPWRAFTSSESIETLETSTGATTQYGKVAIDYTDYSFKQNQTILAPSGRWKIPAHTPPSNPVTWTQKVDNGQTAASFDSPAVPWTSDPPVSDPTVATEPADHTQSYFRASQDKYGQSEHGYDTVTITVTQASPSEITISGSNTGGNDAWLVSPANYSFYPVGTAALWIRGTLVEADNPTTIYVGTGSPLFTFPSNAYRQDRDAATQLAQWVLTQVTVPFPEYQNVGLMFDPRLVVSDRITLTDPDVSLVQTDVTAWGKHVSIDRSSGGLTVTMGVDVRPIAPPGGWILGAAGRSELGSTAYLY